MILALVSFGASELIVGSNAIIAAHKTENVSVTRATSKRSANYSPPPDNKAVELQSFEFGPELVKAMSMWFNTIKKAYAESFWHRCVTEECIACDR